MVSNQTTDFAELFATLFSSNQASSVISASSAKAFIKQSHEGCVLRSAIIVILAEYYQSLSAKGIDFQAIQRSPFDHALVDALSGKTVSIEELSFLEKIIICNVSFIFGGVDVKCVSKIAHVLTNTFTKNKEVMTLFLLEEEEARSKAFLLLGYTLLDLAIRSAILKDSLSTREQFYDVVESLDKCFDTDIDVLAESLYLVTRGIDCKHLDIKEDSDGQSLYSYQDGPLDVLLTFEGKNIGLGSIVFDHVKFVSFGPQVLDLGQIENYGINFSNHNRINVSLEENKSSWNCRGWSRIQGDLDVWVEHDLRIKENELDLFVSFESFKEDDPEIVECFFVCANEVAVDGKIVKKGSLNRHRSIARTLEIKEGDTTVLVEVLCGAICQVIPLAGGDYYWGSNFLVSFEPKDVNERIHLHFSSK